MVLIILLLKVHNSINNISTTAQAEVGFTVFISLVHMGVQRNVCPIHVSPPPLRERTSVFRGSHQVLFGP